MTAATVVAVTVSALGVGSLLAFTALCWWACEAVEVEDGG